jgi:hypothetical protein
MRKALVCIASPGQLCYLIVRIERVDLIPASVSGTPPRGRGVRFSGCRAPRDGVTRMEIRHDQRQRNTPWYLILAKASLRRKDPQGNAL